MNYHCRTCPFFVTGLTEADTSIKMGVLFFPIPNDLNDSKTRLLYQDNFKKTKNKSCVSSKAHRLISLFHCKSTFSFYIFFKDKAPLLFSPHISRTEASHCYGSTVYLVLAPCWGSLLISSFLATECLQRKPFVPISNKFFRELDYSKAFILYIYIQERSLKSASLIKEGNLLLTAKSLPNYSDYSW